MFKSEKGFSLIELMVVVAIIGILSAVAVPQFQKFQRKAKQAEARSSLAAVYTAQKTFLAETGTYYSNLWATGFEPEGLIEYNIGVRAVDISATSPSGYTASPYTRSLHIQTFTICGNTYAGGISQNCSYQNMTNLLTTGSVVGTHEPVTSSTFLIHAISSSNDLGGSTHDQWSINHRKELINTLNGAL